MATLPSVQVQSSSDERIITTQDVAALCGKPHREVMLAANTLIKQRKNFSFYSYTFLHARNRHQYSNRNMAMRILRGKLWMLRSAATRGTETPRPPDRALLELIDQLKGGEGDGCEYHLCNAVAGVDGEWLPRTVEH